MNGINLRKAEFLIPEWIVKHWCIACYLVINWRIKDLIEKIKFEPDEDFYKIVANYVYDYVRNDKMPPEDIAPTIMNLGEDFIAGRKVQFRAGDYIAVQNHLRNLKKKG